MSGIDLVVVGDANPDVIVDGAPSTVRFGQREQLIDAGALVLGGSAAITACGAARLGLRTALVAAVGADAAGTFVLDCLQRAGVDTSAVRVVQLPTPLSVILRAGADRAILTSRGAMDALRATDVPSALLADCRYLHASSYFLQPGLGDGLPELFATARTMGVGTSLDTNDDPADNWAGVSDVLPHTDVLLPNGREVVRLAGHSGTDAFAAASALADRGVLPVVTLGADGAMAWSARYGAVAAPAVGVSAVDTIGAGDSFTAGFLAARADGLPLVECLGLAAACGSLSTRAVGGTAAQPTRTEALAALGQTAR